MINNPLVDDHILIYEESQRFRYLMLHEFILSCSDEITCEKKFNIPFYTCNGLLLYISFDKKNKHFYIGFCNGRFLKDESKILDTTNTKLISKWYYTTKEHLQKNKTILKSLIIESIQINNKKRKSKV